MKLQYVFITLLSVVILTSCGVTPNVTMTVTPNQCAPTGYCSNVLLQNANLPAISGYCAMVTVQNNTSGYGANNVQTIGNGFMVNNTTICDPNSSGQTCTQNSSNVYLLDPNNCVTTTGASVFTLKANGGTCNFYLQLSGEATPIGANPVAISYTYTNGNSTYSLNQNIFANTSLYIATDNSLLSYTGGANTAPLTSTKSSLLTTDSFGNLYSYNVDNNQLNKFVLFESSTPQPIAVTGSASIKMIGDNYGNVELLSPSGIYKYNQALAESRLPTTGLTPVNDITTDSLGNFYAVGDFSIVFCALSNSCWNPYLSSGATAMVFNYNTTSFATYSTSIINIYNVGLPSTQAYSTNLNSVITSADSDGAGNFYTTTVDQGLYMLPSASGYTQVSMPSGSGATLGGTLNKLVVDNSGDVYVFGSAITSGDFTGGNIQGVWYNKTTKSAWTPIPVNTKVNSAVVLTQLSLN